ncbi:MAG: hypothetical protein A2X49_02880 [Lentisphaerae bacterium GWF2_52_8]|nr:MAG: hypothetical protein A2X49_02880 [Lentisphaerae bacterium GWF2_52_8]
MKNVLSSDEIKALEDISSSSGMNLDSLQSLLCACLEASSFDSKLLLARMRWLMLPENMQGLDIIGNFGAMDEQALLQHILHPKSIVFKLIRERCPLDTANLQIVYDAMASSHTPTEMDRSLPDFTEERILQEMKWWLVTLNFPKYYFDATPPAEIGQQIRVNRFHEMYGVKTKSYESLKISYTQPSGHFMHWAHKNKMLEVEREIENLARQSGRLYEVSVYTHGDLLLYLGSSSAPGGEGNSFKDAAPGGMSRALRGEAKSRYEKIWREMSATGNPVIARSTKEETGEHRLMLAFPFGYLNHFLSNVSRALVSSGVKVTRKYCVVLGGKKPAVISSFYSMSEFPEDILARIVSIALYPHKLGKFVDDAALDPDEANFINSAIAFVHQFAIIPDRSVSFLKDKFKHSDELQEILRNLQRRIDKDSFSLPEIMNSFTDRIDLSKALFREFKHRCCNTPAEEESFEERLKKENLPPVAAAVFKTALSFVENVQRTNFFAPLKTALAFRLRNGFLGNSAYPKEPFAVFFLKGRNFTGFHVRFKDIARGGIRILRPASDEERNLCMGNLFEECYNLASTQDKKNKDIPEGGAKGVVALENSGASHEAAVEAFKQYVDALLDLLVQAGPDGQPQDLLFLGPDEGSADLMDWAAERARDRGWALWKGFTTGKCAALGGVSHIDYGMTTNGVREYVECIYRKLGLDGTKIRKLQTGGPDGDLGSNEILLSNEKTIAVVDGGGVIYDPNGLDKQELERLAKARVNSSNFDESKLGPGGFKVLVTDKAAKIPGSNSPVSGLAFRNAFHLDKRFRAELFVPCGGRPKSIDSTNWTSLLDESGNPPFKWIVEGANLFLTPEARLRLEEKGVLIFKDSSTNKGGVTSSSLEVLSGIVLNDREYAQHMRAEPNKPEPAFRSAYIKDTVAIVRENARAEFELLWKLREESGKALSLLSDIVSEKINSMTNEIAASELFDNLKLRKAVLLSAIPDSLLKLAGPAKALRRMPLNYQRALFARTVARKFVYKHGPNANFESYRNFINTLA